MLSEIKFLFFFMIVGLLTLAALALITFLIWGCCPKIARPNVTNYPIDKTQSVITPQGACVLLNGNIVSNDFLNNIDQQISDTEDCIKTWFGTRQDIMHRAYNWKSPKRSCYTIIIAPDWRVSCEDPTQQVFGSAPKWVCEQKGFEETPECKCGWRVAIQNGENIITTPNLYMFRIGVVELLTGWPQSDIWKNDDLIKCGGF